MQVSSGATSTEKLDSDEELLISFAASKSHKTVFSLESPSAYLTPLEGLLPQPAFSLESPSAYLTPLEGLLPQPQPTKTTQGSTSNPSSIIPKIAVLSSALVEGVLDIQDDVRSDLSSIKETEVRKVADSFHDTFNATS